LELEEIIKGCIKNNASSQKALYAMFARKMMGICYRYVKSREAAEDVLQEAFIDIFAKIKSYRGEGSFEGWIRRITVGHAIANFRKEIKQNNHFVDIDEVEHSLHSYNQIIESISAGELVELINSLPDGFRIVLNLYSIEGYSHKEIGEMLKITESSSRSQLTRAKKALEKVLRNNATLAIHEQRSI
jgi:RNA polymerase sigma-70 factor (ECF subfamily)